MEHNKAPCPDGFLAEFYQSFWDIIKHDLLELFGELHAGQLDLFRINFGKIILLPKKLTWNVFNNIDLYACLMFILIFYQTTIILNSMEEHVVRPSQTAVMQGRHILDGVVTMHETVREMHQKKLNGVILKINFNFLPNYDYT
jgi:hypothetical protein